MFLGEMLCFLPVLYTWVATHRQAPVHLPPDSEQDPHVAIKLGTSSQTLSGWKVLLLWIPAICDLTGTTVSIRRLGVGLVGWSGSLVKDAIKEVIDLSAFDEPEATQVLVGVFFILFAQVFTATQFVVEEKIMERYSVTPLVAVGFEGLFGAISILVLFPVLALPSVSKLSPFFDLPRGWHQMIDNASVLYSGIAIAFSIAFFNYFGLSVTRHVSATARSLTDTCRTLSIWLISLGLGWEKFIFPTSFLQVTGFSLLV
ncbi:hypothetical protein C0992_012158 [Termitomyces sp. T32_za158]|nr:hypothetical protein C0992_012158 [Termitomyces sp. T32_za158]